jgi:surface polysaccharide O-acyltransferase-like enzyme
MMQNAQNRIPYLDNLRVVATAFIILLHCITPLITNVSIFAGRTWWALNIINSITRAGVPIFFMLSGYLLLNDSRTSNFKSFYKRRFVKILVPFIVWDIIYFLFNSIQSGQTISPALFFTQLIDQGSEYHLWFVYTLAAFYLIMPFLKLIIDKCSDNQMLLFFFILIFPTTMRPFLNTVLGIYIYLFDGVMNGYTGYLILGYYLGKNEISKAGRILLYTGGIIGVLISVLGNYACSSKERIDLVFNGGYQINNFLVPAAVFLFFKQMKTKANGIINLAGRLSPLTYGIYLIHVLLLKLISGFTGGMAPVYVIALTFIGTAVLSTSLVFVLSKIKVLNKVLL